MPWLTVEGLWEAVGAHYEEGKSRRNIEVRQAKLGQAVAKKPRWLVAAIKGGKKRFSDRQVSTKGAEKAEIEALTLVHLRKFYSKVWVEPFLRIK